MVLCAVSENKHKLQGYETVSAKRHRVASLENGEDEKENIAGISANTLAFADKHEMVFLSSASVYLTLECLHLDQGYTSEGVEYARLREPIMVDRPRKLVFNGEVGDWRLDDSDFIDKFTLPNADNKFDQLALRNPFPRDARIEFIEKTHDYIIDGKVKAPRSVTKLLHQYQEPFDAPTIISKMKQGRNWHIKREAYLTHEGIEMSSEQIEAKWETNRIVASSRGTLMHFHIEMFMNGAQLHGPYSIEFGYFQQFYREFMMARGLVPVRTELSVFHTGLCCAGQLDLLAKYAGSDSYVILDWKRSKEIKHSNCFQKMLPPLTHLDQCNFNTYSLQLNLYKYILESEYDLHVDELFLAIFHESQEMPVVLQVSEMPVEVAMIIKHEKQVRNAQDPHPGADAPFTVGHILN